MNPNQVNQDVNNARNTGRRLQNQYDQQANQTYGQYNDTYNQALESQQSLRDYTRKIAGMNYGDIYSQDLSNSQSKYGFDPKSLALANKNLLNTQTAMQYAPQSSTQAGNYYGGTAGQAMSAYQNMAGNLNTTLANQSNAVGQYKDLLSATQNEANQQTTQQLAGQQQALSGYEAVAQNSTNIMNNASQTMTAIEKLQQDQGTVTAGQVKAYQDAYSNYVTAQAAASTAASYALTQRATANQTIQNTIDQGIRNHPNATNAQLAAELNVPESVIAGIRPYGGANASGYNPQSNRPRSNQSVGEGSNSSASSNLVNRNFGNNNSANNSITNPFLRGINK